MDTTTIYAILFLIVMIMLCGYLLVIFKRNISKNIEKKAMEDHPIKDPSFYLNDVLEASAFLGKTVKETEIDEKLIQLENGLLTVAVEGRLFGGDAHGKIYFDSVGDEIVKHASSVYIYSAMPYEDCKDSLANAYGEAQNESEETVELPVIVAQNVSEKPAAEASGEALSESAEPIAQPETKTIKRCSFSGEGFGIELSKASDSEELEIIIK